MFSVTKSQINVNNLKVKFKKVWVETDTFTYWYIYIYIYGSNINGSAVGFFGSAFFKCQFGNT